MAALTATTRKPSPPGIPANGAARKLLALALLAAVLVPLAAAFTFVFLLPKHAREEGH